ncbi:NAD(P)-dependent oxidoreductase [Fodinibius saliphilus]|uniref:NAD(P)-dependent oxidoreductase n=1 Tax=Fodinibius saliphilus TaxID=1920650 RepID=UPI001109C074|nr:NAD(P)-dependent oxidoreductase [Fodinibius saliphilus]
MSLMLNILADQHLYNIQSYLPENINLQLFDPVHGFPPEISTAHGLLVRTVIPVNKETLPDIPNQLSFVGSGSAGTDHVDIPYLNKHDVTFANAEGCNARSVAEYVGTALLLWAENRQKDLTTLTVGVIGVGNVGSEVIQLLERLGITTIGYDPPRELRDDDYISATLDEVLASDILTFHTPLTQKGTYPTYHWLDFEKLSQHTFEIIINSARGGIIDEKAMLDSKTENQVGDIIIDVWEDEPNFSLETAKQAFLKTPHIAGYSVQAKSNASKFVVDDLLAHFNLEAPKQQNQQSSHTLNQKITNFDTIGELLKKLHPIKKYEKNLEKIIQKAPNQRGIKFNELRAEFPLREEFSNTYLPAAYFDRFPQLDALGFSLLRDAK